ncbi:integrase catalytic domain-containing protein [Trichonephila clavipes]|uniref:Integrase catalytic domain-containing protein n=1 Tax=Trichonephila clavipes TaxID=2585209 RepID=A0A8X6W6I6_TRICX|nr:integrase catalytic domain-containing protein [Trichonephila clavipes]
MVKSATRGKFYSYVWRVRNRCLHLATGRTRDDKRKGSGNDGGRKARNERGEGGEENRVGRLIIVIAEPSLTEVSDNRLKVWQKQTKIVQQIWKRWSNNYLSTLQNRNRCYFEKNNVKKHGMVILKEDNLPVCNWPFGRILEVYHDIIKMGRTILLERRQSESVGRRNNRTIFLRSDWPRPFARREVGVEMELGRSENKRPEQRRS